MMQVAGLRFELWAKSADPPSALPEEALVSDIQVRRRKDNSTSWDGLDDGSLYSVAFDMYLWLTGDAGTYDLQAACTAGTVHVLDENIHSAFGHAVAQNLVSAADSAQPAILLTLDPTGDRRPFLGTAPPSVRLGGLFPLFNPNTKTSSYTSG